MTRWVCASLVAVAVASAGPVAAQGNAVAGKEVFAKKCGACHDEKGAGKPAIAKMLKVEMRHLGSKEVKARSDEDLSGIITKGKEKMKPVQGLSAADVANVVAYVRGLTPP
jgi:mono/diheme cytochrome c family protein